VLKAEIERLRGLVRNGDRVVNGEDVLRISGGEVLREEEK
jgi:hypothetical protein